MAKPNRYILIITFFTITFIVLISRMPFLLPGYGLDPDAWGVAYIAWQISKTHEYAVSRFPGYPLQELTYALVWKGGPLLLNGLTALFSGVATGFLALSGKKLGYPVPIIAALIFAFTPVIYINSVNSLDYLWSISFVLGSLYLALSSRTYLAGLLLGLAIGTRITSAAMLLPLVLILIYQGIPRKAVLYFAIISTGVGGLFYLPALFTYGSNFFTYHGGASIPPKRILSNATIGVWGWTGFGAIIVAMSVLLWLLIRYKTLFSLTQRPGYWKIWLIPISIYLLIYLYLPHEAGYLIPIVPFTILFFQEFLTKKIFLLLGFAVISSSLLIGFYSGYQIHSPGFDQQFRSLATRVHYWKINFFFVPFYGLLQSDHSSRADEIERFEKVIAFGNDLQDKSIIIVGWNLPKFAKLGLYINRNSQNIIYTEFLDRVALQNYLDNGFQIYYLPEMLPASIEQYKIDLREFGGTAIDID